MRSHASREPHGQPKSGAPVQEHHASPSPFPDREAMPWQMIRMSVAQVVSGEHETIQDSFVLAFATAGRPQRAALFSHPVVGGHELYFSPEAVRIGKALIQQCGGSNCTRPPKEGTRLLVGHKGARDRLL